MSSSEKELVTRALSADREALAALLECFGPSVREEIEQQIPSQCRSVLSGDDVMQQTYTDAFLGIDHFVPLGEGAFRAWLASLAKFNLRDAVAGLRTKKRGGDRKQVARVGASDSYVELLELLSSSGTSPSGFATRGEIQSAIAVAVDELPEAYGRVVRLYDLEQKSVEEVAAEMGRSIGAVYMVRARALDRLRYILGRASKFFTDSP